MNIKNNKGITLVDISISIMIIFLFSSLITGLIYNYSTSTKTVNRKAEATYQAINIIETIKTINYEDMQYVLENYETTNGITKNETIYIMGVNTLKTCFTNFTNITLEDIPNGYSAEIQLEKYNEKSGNETKEDIIITATVKVTYKVGTQNKNVELKTLLVKEIS